MNVIKDKIMKELIRKARESDSYILPDSTLMLNKKKEGENNSMLVVGSPGTFKSTRIVIPNILAGGGGSSLVISDTKNNLYELCASELEEMGYDVYHLDFVEPQRSCRINPLAYIKNYNDVQKVSGIIVNLDDIGGDPAIKKSEELFLNACLGLMLEGGTGKITFEVLNKIVSGFDSNIDDPKKPSASDLIFKRHKKLYKEKTGKESWAYEQYVKFNNLMPGSKSNIILYVNSDLASIDTPEMRYMLSRNSFDILSLGKKKTAVFINVSDTDRSKDFAVNLFYTQAMDALCRYADSLPDKSLDVPVRFMLDDFGTSSKIVGFESMISNIRSRNISVMLILQSITQLDAFYGKSSSTIIAGCATRILMGGYSDLQTAEFFAKLANVPVNRISEMKRGTNLMLRSGRSPSFSSIRDSSEAES